ncbi:MAG: PEP-CTERM sorting domain-containing protein [Telluria sp.]
MLTYQDVVFTTSWANNVLTLEIDAARHSGDWTRATMLGAVGIKGIGQFGSVALSSAPTGAGAWKLSSLELNAKGCSGGGGKNSDTTALCLSGGPIELADNMVFAFAFSGAPDLDEPHLKVNFLDSRGKKTGDLVSLSIPASAVVVPPPGTPVIPPVTPPVVPPVTPPVVPPVTPPVVPPVTPPVVPPVTPPVVPPVTPPVTPPVMPPVTPPLVTPPIVELPDSINEVPEPQSVALMLAGLALMGMVLRKRS